MNDHGNEHPSHRALVIIPTFNGWRICCRLIVGRVHKAIPDVPLVVDDDSPDGTGALADELSLADPTDSRPCTAPERWPRRRLPSRLPRGGWGEYDVLVEMDADGSHAPELSAVAGRHRRRRRPGGRFPHRGGTVRTGRRRAGVRDPPHSGSLGFGSRHHHPAIRALPWSGGGRGHSATSDRPDLTSHSTVAEVPITFAGTQLGVSKMSGSNIRSNAQGRTLGDQRPSGPGPWDRALHSRPNTALRSIAPAALCSDEVETLLEQPSSSSSTERRSSSMSQ